MALLVVDDNWLALQELTSQLGDLGYHDVVTAMDGIEALKLAGSMRPSTTLMDIHMPGSLDGIDAARVLIGLYDVPVIFVTALTDAAIVDRAIRVGALGYVLKPTNRGALESTLRLVAYNWELQAEKAVDMALAVDGEYRVTFLNRPAEGLFGPEAQMRGKLLREVISPDSDASINELFKPQSDVPVELQVQSERHGRRILRFTSTPIKVGEELFGYRLMARDVTEDMERRARFLREQRLNVIGSMTAGIIHDLNNALMPVMAGSGILMKRESNPETQRILQLMATSAQHGGALVKQLLAFTKGSASVKNTDIDAAAIVRDVAEVIKPLFPKEVRIEVSTEGPAPVFGSADELRQAMMNLCVNARDAMSGKGILTLRVENIVLSTGAVDGLSAGRYCMIRVKDSGPGIPTHLRHQIFSPFFSTKGSNGTGLGLSTVARIVREIGGTVRLGDNESGAEFELLLPLTDHLLSSTEDREEDIYRGNGEWIVVADDNSTNLELTRQMLEVSGYNVLLARNGLEAIKALDENLSSVRLAILDMEMPFMNGGLASMKLKDLKKSLRIIMTSGGIPESRQVDFPRVDRFVDKPYTMKELLTAVQAEIVKYG